MYDNRVNLNNLLQTERFARKWPEALEKEKDRIAAMMGIEFLSCDSSNLAAFFKVPVFDWELNSDYNMHGGITATILDSLLGWVANYLSLEVFRLETMTTNINVNYLRPIPKGAELIVKAQVTSFGSRLITTYGECRLNGDEGLAATSTATFIVRKK